MFTMFSRPPSCQPRRAAALLRTAPVQVVDPRLGHPGPLARRDERDLGVVQHRHVVLPVRRHQHPQAGARNVVAHLVPQRLQDRHLVVAGDQARMDQQQMLLAVAQVLGDLRGHPRDQVEQVVPVRAGAVRAVRLLDGRPVDLQFLGLLTQGVEEQVVERDPLQLEPPHQFVLAPPHPAGPDREDEEAAVGVGVPQPLLELPGLGHVGRHLDCAGRGRRGPPTRDRRARRGDDLASRRW